MKAFIILCLLWTIPVQASILDIYGFNPRARAMGNAHVAAADDYTGVFYNPATLTRRKTTCIGMGFLASLPALYIDRDFANPHQRDVQNEIPIAFHGINIGALFPLGGLIENRVALGVSLYMPTLNLLRAQALDPQIPQFYRYQSLPDKFVFLGGVAFELTDWLSLGTGFQVLATFGGAVSFDVELANHRIQQRNVQVDIEPIASPTAGIDLRPLPNLTIGASWRGALQLDFTLPVAVHIDDLLDLNIELAGTMLYTPHVFNLGAAYTIKPAHLLISAEWTYELWSLAPDPSPFVTLDVAGRLVDGIGIGERFDIGQGATVVLNFRDTSTLKLGMEHTLDNLKLRAGYTWRPSPAPVPTQIFNYIDNDAHLLSVGAGFSFTNVHLDAVYQVTLMMSQRVDKVAGDADRVGDYQVGGAIHSVGIALRHDL